MSSKTSVRRQRLKEWERIEHQLKKKVKKKSEGKDKGEAEKSLPGSM